MTQFLPIQSIFKELQVVAVMFDEHPAAASAMLAAKAAER